MSTDVIPNLTTEKVRVTPEADGALWRVTLDAPKGNIIDAAMTVELTEVISAVNFPVIAAVRGSCLGGGLELVSFCHRIFAHPGAKFAQPEITLGVFAPVASAILAERVGRGAADDLLPRSASSLSREARTALD